MASVNNTNKCNNLTTATKKNTILLLLSSIELTSSNTSYLKEGEKGIDRLVPDNDGDGDLDDVGVGEQGSTSRQLHPCSGEPPTLRPGMPAHTHTHTQRERERERERD